MKPTEVVAKILYEDHPKFTESSGRYIVWSKVPLYHKKNLYKVACKILKALDDMGYRKE